MTTMETMSAEMPRRPSRWFSFSLRSLFVMIALVSVVVVSFRSCMRWATLDTISPALLAVRYRSANLLPDSTEQFEGEREYKLYRATQLALLKSTFVLTAALRRPELSGIALVNRHKSDAVSWLQEFLDVHVVDDSEVIAISFNDGSPLERVAIANTIKDAYLDEIVQAEREEELRRRDILQRLYAKTFQEFKEKLAAIHAPSDPETPESTEGDSASTELELQRLELSLLETQLRRLKEQIYLKTINIESRPRIFSIQNAKAR